MSTLDFLRDIALEKRLNHAEGGKRIIWSARDATIIRDFIASVNRDHLIRATQPIETKRSPEHVDITKFGAGVKADIGSNGDPVFVITSPRVDLVGDSVNVNGVDLTDFKRNPAVLFAHNSGTLPVGTSSVPWLSGDKMLASVRFPDPGVSADSDRVAAAVRAKLIRGASVGFIPLKWSFSKDPARPLGVDFHSCRLLEWSCCSIPCNPDALLVGAVAGGASSTTADSKMAERIREAARLTANARRLSSTPQTRAERVAEAAAIRRSAYRL